MIWRSHNTVPESRKYERRNAVYAVGALASLGALVAVNKAYECGFINTALSHEGGMGAAGVAMLGFCALGARNGRHLPSQEEMVQKIIKDTLPVQPTVDTVAPPSIVPDGCNEMPVVRVEDDFGAADLPPQVTD